MKKKISPLSATSTLNMFKDYFNLMLLLQNACLGSTEDLEKQSK